MSGAWKCVPGQDVRTSELLEEQNVEIFTRLAHALDTSVEDLMVRAPTSWFERTEVGDAFLDSKRCRELLESETLGRVGFTGPAGPMVLPVNYVFSDGRVIFRTSHRSPLSHLDGARVVFEVDRIEHENRKGSSVLVAGIARTVDAASLQLGCAMPRPWAGAGRDVWVIIDAGHITGRQVGPGEGEKCASSDRCVGGVPQTEAGTTRGAASSPSMSEMARGSRRPRPPDSVIEEHLRLVHVHRPALMRALSIADRDDYEDAAAEHAILTAELTAVETRIAMLGRGDHPDMTPHVRNPARDERLTTPAQR